MSILCSIPDIYFKTDLPYEVVFLLRVLLGGALGLLVGIERSRRQKEAGMATHFVVGTASTLYTCVSIMMSDISDGGRIAAQVVSGIGFLGAGMIFFRRENLRGLTTAAGIWATAAIGMCTAVGMYWVALGTTAFIILFQVILHLKFIKRNRQHLLFVKMEYNEEIKAKLMEFFDFTSFHRFKVTSVKTTSAANTTYGTSEGVTAPTVGSGDNATEPTANAETSDKSTTAPTTKMIAETVIYPTENCSAEAIAKFMSENPEIISIERLEDL